MDYRLLIAFILTTMLFNCETKPVDAELGQKISSFYKRSASDEDQDNMILDSAVEIFLLDNIQRHGVLSDISDFFSKFRKKAGDELSSTSLCWSCKFAVSVLKEYVRFGGTESGIAKLARKICAYFHFESERVCAGLSNLFKREMFVVLSKAVFTSKELCGMALGTSCYGDINPLHNWTIPMTPFPKPPVEPIPLPRPGAPISKVLHISDVHLDPYYMEGSLGNCKEPLCCRKESGTPLYPSDAAGYWGDYRNCDTPLRTLESVLRHINKTHKFDYVIWTGDIPPHDIWNNTREDVLKLIGDVSLLMDKYLGSVPIFPALGNHESSPVDSFPIPEVKGNDSISWLYNPVYDMWNKWVTTKNADTMRLGAYYSVPINPGLRIISLNMNYCNTLNWWLLINSTDPADELSWLVKELQISELKGEKVHIIGHIPPGASDCLQVWSKNYFEIIKRYESTVRAQFFGHTHSDEFAVFYDQGEFRNESRPFSIAYIGPSVTTYMGFNPGYRIYTIDGNYEGSSRVVLDHENYIMNLTAANIGGKREPNWFFEYSAARAYNMSSLLPSDWDDLIQSFEEDDGLFQKFYRYYVKQSDHYPNPCDAKCKIQRICSMRSGHSGQDC